jgi:drug/metabolite transporter (DMT)-like permease
MMGLVEPPIAVILGAWFLDERMNARALAGSMLILVSVWLAIQRPKR